MNDFKVVGVRGFEPPTPSSRTSEPIPDCLKDHDFSPRYAVNETEPNRTLEHHSDTAVFKGLLTPGLPWRQRKPEGPRGRQAARRRRGWGYLYVFVCEGRFKVGSSADPAARLDDLQPACPFKIKPVGYRRTRPGRDQAIEDAAHNFLSDYWIHHEWFDAPEDEIASAIRRALIAVKEMGTDVARRAARSRQFIKTETRRANPLIVHGSQL